MGFWQLRMADTEEEGDTYFFFMQLCIIWLIITSVHISLPNIISKQKSQSFFGRERITHYEL